MVLKIKLLLLSALGLFTDQPIDVIIPQVPEPLKTAVYVSKQTHYGNRDMSQIQQGIIKCNDNQSVVCYIVHNNGNIELPAQNALPPELIETNGYEILEDGIYFW